MCVYEFSVFILIIHMMALIDHKIIIHFFFGLLWRHTKDPISTEQHEAIGEERNERKIKKMKKKIVINQQAPPKTTNSTPFIYHTQITMCVIQ